MPRYAMPAWAPIAVFAVLLVGSMVLSWRTSVGIAKRLRAQHVLHDEESVDATTKVTTPISFRWQPTRFDVIVTAGEAALVRRPALRGPPLDLLAYDGSGEREGGVTYVTDATIHDDRGVVQIESTRDGFAAWVVRLRSQHREQLVSALRQFLRGTPPSRSSDTSPISHR